MGLEEVAQGWPKLRDLLNPLAPKITSLQVLSVEYGHKAILRFTNDYGVEIFKHLDDEFFEMTVIRFRSGTYEFAFDTAIPDLNLGYSEAEVLKLCREVSQLK
ncbi:MAG TPA: hypothetical protein VIN67_01045 [Desulfobaccales bacterium]